VSADRRRSTQKCIAHGAKFPRLREAAIAALLSCRTVELAAKQLKIHHATLRRWMRDPDFDGDYRSARERVLERAAERLRDGALAAVEVLMEIAQNRKAPEAARVTACRSFLESTGLLRGSSVVVNNANVAVLDAATAKGQLHDLLDEVQGVISKSEERRTNELPN